MDFPAGQHKSHGLAYSPLKALISPRPIGWISSCSADGIANLAPYSFFNAVAELPPMVMFVASPDLREGRVGKTKDSLENILTTKEFGVNIVGTAQCEAMVESSKTVAADEDEFALAGLKKKQAHRISAPLVADAPAHLECRYYSHIELPDNGDGHHSVMVIGRIEHIHIDDRYIKDGKVDVSAYQPVSRLGYRDYAAVRDVFEMQPKG